MTTGTSQPAQEQQRQLGGHQAGADDPDLGHRTRECGVRGAGGLAGPLPHQVEGVQAGPQLRAHDQVGQRLVLGGEPPARSAVLAAAISSSAR